MAIIAPTPITALPTPPTIADPTDFDTRADAFVGALADPFVDETNAAASNVYNNATEAVLAATGAAASETAAAASATDADTSATGAAASATASAASATLWAAFKALYIGTFASDSAATAAAGGAPAVGVLYFNSAVSQMRVWSGSSWVQASAGAGYLPLSGGTLTGLVTAASIIMTAPLNEAPQATLASASTVNIGAASSNYLKITGTTPITAFDTIASGAEREVEFAGALTLTHNSTSLILPGAANIITAAGDVATFRSEGSGNWRCTKYQRAVSAPSLPWTQIGVLSPASGAGAQSFTSIPAGYQDLLVVFEGVSHGGSAGLLISFGDATPTYGSAISFAGLTSPIAGGMLVNGASLDHSSVILGASAGSSGAFAGVTGGVRAIKIVPNGGTAQFSGAGNIRLLGR